jgi:hypothetical protein
MLGFSHLDPRKITQGKLIFRERHRFRNVLGPVRVTHANIKLNYMNSLKHEGHQQIFKLLVHNSQKHILQLQQKHRLLILHRNFVVYYKNNKSPHTLCGRNPEILNVEAGGGI